MKRILIFNDCLKFGGTEALLVEILNHVSKKQCEVTLLLPVQTENNNLLKNVSDKIKVEYIHKKPLSRLKRILFFNLIALFPGIYAKLNLNLKHYDLIVSFKESPYSSIFSRINKPKILWIHNIPVIPNYEFRSTKERIAVALQKMKMKRYIDAYKYYDKVICVSETCKNKFIEIYNKGKEIENQKIELLYNAIDFTKIGKMVANQELLQKPDCMTFIMATRYSVEKRIDRVINAAHKLNKNGYKFKVIILGNGPYVSDIEKLVSKHGLNEIVSMLGYKENPYPYILQADWLICSSERESFSLVLLESIYLGTPVITTDCGGPTEITENGKYGVLTSNNTEGIYNGMKKVLDNPFIRHQYISQSEECLKRFDYNKWLKSIDRILDIS